MARILFFLVMALWFASRLGRNEDKTDRAINLVGMFACFGVVVSNVAMLILGGE